MGRDDSPKERQRKDLERKRRRQRAPCERLLVVCEGSKTEPRYFDEIRVDRRLPVANVWVSPCGIGTDPLHVVEHARNLFEKGDLHKAIEPRAFDRVFAVFDRDDHQTYREALRLAGSLNGKLKSDERKRVPFQAVASVPSFELWLLLHFEDVRAPIRRDDVMRRLIKWLPAYHKGQHDVFALTRNRLADALARAQALAGRFNAESAPEPYTAVFELVTLINTLRR